MHTPRYLHRFLITISLFAGATSLSFASQANYQPEAFTATYKVLRKGAELGTSTLKLEPKGNHTWQLVSRVKAEKGLASVLGANISEDSHFEFDQGQLKLLDYTYKLDSSVKSKHEHIQIDHKTNKVNVDTDKDSYRYNAKKGMIDHNLLALALKQAMVEKQHKIDLPLATKKRIKTYHYQRGEDITISVPMGTFKTTEIKRVGDDKNFAAFYAKDKDFQVPVKLSQDSGGGITLLLKGYQTH